MPQGIDTGTSQRNLNFALARSMGMESNYAKLGGDNVGRYVNDYYASSVDKSRAAGMRVGHYWVPNANYDPAGAADYFVNNLRGWTSSDFAVLDNESLDGARLYSDAQAATWVRRVQARLGISGRQVKVYLGLSVANSTTWNSVLGTGCGIIIAAYSYAAFTYTLRTIPADRNDGHQVGGIVIGGIATDLNSWKDNAFDYSGSAVAGSGTLTSLPPILGESSTMKLAWTTDGTGWLVTEQGWAGLPSMQVFGLFSRVIDSPKPDTFLRAEVDMMIAQQRLIAVGVQNNTTIDPVKLAAAISDALPGKLSVTATMPPELMAKLDQIAKGVEGVSLTPADFNIQATIDPAMLAAAFDAAVPRVTAAIVKRQGELLSGITP